MKIRIIDEVNCRLEGFPDSAIKQLQALIKYREKDAHMQAAYKLGMWDGNTSLITDDGYTYITELDKVVEMIEKYSIVDLQSVDLIDDRNERVLPEVIDPVEDDYIKEETGFDFRSHQKESVNNALLYRKGVLELSTNAGKAQPLYSKILTPTGWKTMGDITVGDYVIGSDGNPKKVTGVFPQGVKDVYEVVMVDKSKTRCCLDHLWQVTTKHRKTKGQSPIVKPLKDIIDDLEFSDGSKKWQVPKLNQPVLYSEVEAYMPLHPWVLGALIGDGHIGGIGQNTSFSNIESDVIDRVTEYFETMGFYTVAIERGIRLNHKGKLNPILDRLGLSMSRSWDKKIPEQYMMASVDDRLELLRGLIDTDGFVAPHYIEYVTTSHVLSEQVKDLVRSLGGKANVTLKEEPVFEYKGEKKIGRKAYRVFIRFDNGTIPYSSEKHRKVKTSSKVKPISTTISTVTKVDECECQCIMVDSDDHLYVTDDNILTHNTNIVSALSKVLDPYTKTLIIVPYESLANQTYEGFSNFDLSVLLLTAKIKPKDRAKKIREHRHIVVTVKLMMNCLEYFQNEHFAVFLDEAHRFGDKTEEALRIGLAHCQFRIGLTGTFPKEKKDPLKRATIIGCMGGGILATLSPRELIAAGHASIPTIEMVKVKHREVEDIFIDLKGTGRDDNRMDWSVEQNYLWTNQERIEQIAKFIKSRHTDNTLVLAHAQVGSLLVEHLGGTMIKQETEIPDRDALFDEFGHRDDVLQVASYGTSATGISQNRIFTLVLVDAGKDETTVLQSIGRGLRLDGVVNKIRIIDISSNTVFSQDHRKARIKIYKEQEFEYFDSVDLIEVK